MTRDKLFEDGVEYKDPVQLDIGEGHDISSLSWNVECLRTCLEDVEFISFVRSYDLFFCSETWQTAKDSYEISGYKCFDVPRPSSLMV